MLYKEYDDRDSFSQLSDRDLLARIRCAAEQEHRATAHLIALQMELDVRRLYLGEGCSSLFTYCTQVLHLSEHAAYGRIEAARAARRFPVILELLAEGAISLTAIGLLAPHLTQENHSAVLNGARHKSKRDVEHLVARLHPRPEVPATVRKLPESKVPAAAAPQKLTFHEAGNETSSLPVRSALPPSRLAQVQPLAPERYKMQFTVGSETYEDLRRVQDLLRHTIPNGDLAAIFERALKLLLAELTRTKVANVSRPQARRQERRASRHVPAEVKREVWQRDEGRCAFRGAQGRCTETGFLEFHHVVPFAEATTTANIELRCRAHNAYEAERWFGSFESPLLREARISYEGGVNSVRT
jgi:5-methylcytosine-specific restriction endonuclease McrA